MRGILQEVVRSNNTVSFQIIARNNVPKHEPQLYVLDIAGRGFVLARKFFDSERLSDFKDSNLLISEEGLIFVILKYPTSSEKIQEIVSDSK